MNKIEVSVYCLAYNHEKYIRKTLDGFIMQQTNFKYEVIVHDDASTDQTKKIIEEYANLYPDIIKPIYQTENQYSRQVDIIEKFIFPKVKGRYIASCEGDDYWNDKFKLQKQYDALEAHTECSISVHRVNCCNEDGSPNKKTYPANKYPLHDEKIIREDELVRYFWIRGGYLFHTSSYFYRTTIIYENISLDRDVGILRKCLLNGSTYYFDEPMSTRRLWAVGSFNSRLRSRGIEGKIWLSKSNIALNIKFDHYSNYKYHFAIMASVFKEIMNWALYDTIEAKELLKKYDLNYQTVFNNLTLIQKIKHGLTYFTLINFPELLSFKGKIKKNL